MTVLYDRDASGTISVNNTVSEHEYVAQEALWITNIVVSLKTVFLFLYWETATYMFYSS